MKARHLLAATALFLLTCGAAQAAPGDPNAPLPYAAKPEDVGFSSQRLVHIGEVLKADIDAGRIPGAVIAIARHGKLVAFDAYGWRDKAANTPMTTDTIFNIASMTKPMTTVAVLTLYEKGQILMDDPLAKYFPKFAGQRVAARGADGQPTLDTVPANRAITIQDLLRHTSGLVYGNRGNTVVHKLYPQSASDNLYTGPGLVDKLASVPLMWQPGSTWDYGFGLDVAGQVVEKITGTSLGRYIRANISTPLGMKDTGFYVQGPAVARYAQPLPKDPDTGAPQIRSPELTKPPSFDCGGGCASSTARDYMLFATMLLNKGHYAGGQIISQRTAEYMLSNQLGPNVRNLIAVTDPTKNGYAFGLGVAIKPTVGVTPTMGSPGSFSWPGAAGTDFWVDPKEDLVVVYLSAAPGPIRWHSRQKINALGYQALGS